ncbi:internalin-related protein [Enhygromyxa salina]|uniref:Internalin-related protein n=1 Tax=Enhygromyxa salina TaxID=215803 RepID=A0A0C1ZIM1_9BACT|nr:leucine-rich repeat domain-containing protein [Enhygromyxa salina]KIG17384.1 internalin-related protein [Enhygromyxa salina]
MARPQLEAALRHDPHDEHAWSVFGDLLAAEGDSRGELIALEQRAAACERPFERSVLEHRAAELFERDHRRWLGPAAEAGLELTWVRGFVTKAVINRRHGPALEALLATPTAALLGRVECVAPRSLGPIAKALTDRPITALGVRLSQGSRPFGSLEQLEALAQLVELEIEGGAMPGLAALANLPRLRRLSLRRFAGDLTGLERGFAKLRSLDLSARANVPGLGPDALQPLAQLEQLRELVLSDGGWERLEPLAGLRAITRLDLRSTDVSDLAPLAAMVEMRELDLSGCTHLTNIEPLTAMTQLERLAIGYTRVRQLGALRGLQALRTVELAGTPVHDLSPLFELPKLRKVGVAACEVDSIQPLLDRAVMIAGLRTPEPSWRDLAEGLLNES